MKKLMFAIAAGLLLSLPAACMHPGYHGGPGGRGCPKHQGCDCTCRQQPECPKQQDCPKRPDCPQNRQQEPPPPTK
jgi:hypothetical protein